jgi:deoxyhypusine synthase
MSKVTDQTNSNTSEKPVMTMDRSLIIASLRSVIANLVQNGVLASLPSEASNPLNNLKEAERLLVSGQGDGREALLKAVKNFARVLQVLRDSNDTSKRNFAEHIIIAGLRRVIANLVQNGVLTSLPSEASNPLNNLEEAERLVKSESGGGCEVLSIAIENFASVLRAPLLFPVERLISNKFTICFYCLFPLLPS